MTGRSTQNNASGERNRQILIDLQRSTFEENRARIAEYEQILSPDFETYEETYNREVSSFEDVISIGQLMASVRRNPCVLVGDYHTLPISQKSFLKILRRIRRQRVVIGLELFDANSQDAVDAYVLRNGAERTLLRRSKVVERWPYPVWKRFKPIIDLARQRGWRVVALDTPVNSGATLQERDHFMASRLLDCVENSPAGTCSISLVGELHLASGHLPLSIRDESIRRSMEPMNSLCIFQNPGPIYWELVDRKLEQDVEVVQIDKNRFALNSAPPIVVQQSYLNWIDYNAATLEYDHLSRHFRKVAQKIEKALSLRSNSSIQEIEVFGPGDYSYWDELSSHHEKFSERVAFERGQDSSRLFPNDGIVYLSNLNINHVGEVAGRLIHALNVREDISTMTGFYSRVMHNAFAFFSSKIVNPKRKAHQLPYFRALLQSVSPENPIPAEELEVASAILLHKQFEKGRRTRAFHRLFNGSSEKQELLVQELGFMLGEKLYYAFSRGRISRADIRNLLNCPMSDVEQSAAYYFSIARQVDRERIPTRM